MFLGLRTVIHPVADLAAATAWFSEVLGHSPYFEEPFYVGFEVAGYELGLLPVGADGEGARLGDGALAYWGVRDAGAAVERLVAAGAAVHTPIADVGEGIRTATVRSPDGSIVGVIENPHFSPPDPSTVDVGDGPGR